MSSSRDHNPSSSDDRLLRASVVVTALGLVSKALGLLREIWMASLFGATRSMDAFIVAKSLPDMISTWIEQPIRSAIVPMFVRVKETEGERRAWEMTSNLLCLLGLVLVVLVLFLEIGSELIVRLLSTGFREAQQWSEAAELTRLMLCSLVFSSGGVILGTLSNIYHRQLIPGLARLLGSMMVLLWLVVFGRTWGLRGVAVALVVGSLASFLVQADILFRNWRYLRFRFDPRAAEVRELVSVAAPIFVGLSATRVDVAIDRNLASFLPEGSLAILSYGMFISVTFTELAITATSSVFLPHVSSLIAARQLNEVRSLLGNAICAYAYFAIPIAAMVIGGARELVDLAFLRGSFSVEAATLTALIVPVIAASDPFTGVGQILAQVHIGAGDSKTPMWIGLKRIAAKTLLSLALVGWLGIVGLVVAAALANALRATLLWRRLPIELRPLRAFVMPRLARQLLAGVAVAFLANLVFKLIELPPDRLDLQIGRALLVGLICAAAWSLITTLLGERILHGLLSRVRESLPHRRRNR